MTNLFSTPNDILGLNERNLKYIRRYNSRASKRIADDKLLTKKILLENGIPTPDLVGEIKSTKAFESFNFAKLPGSIVVKPKKGFGGEGIIVFFSKDKHGEWVKADKTRYDAKDLKSHISGILEGNFSLKNKPDTAFFEERVLMHPDFKKYSYRGIPDIRIIVFNKVPVMAQLRLPTKESDGKANLHAGGIGVGIDIASGITTTSVHHDKLVERHPDTGILLKGIKIPFWHRILEMSVATQICTGLGFLGVDIVIDRVKGPIVLELNARPGLAIQIANQDGLKARLERVAGLKIPTIKKGVQVGKDLFGGEIEEEIEEVSGKQLVGRVEYANIYGDLENPIQIKVKNDTGALISSLDESLARTLGYDKLLDEFNAFEALHPFSDLKEGRKVKLLAQRHFEDYEQIVNIALVKQSRGLDLRPIVKIPFEMSGVRQDANFTITHRKDMIYGAIIGRKALKKFLIDPARKFLG
jgi:alpha-L-glutamate ligase-like protein